MAISRARLGAEKGQGSVLSPLSTNLIQTWDDLAGGGFPHQRDTSSSPPHHDYGFSGCWGCQEVSSDLLCAGSTFTASPNLNSLALDGNLNAERSGLSQFELETKYLNPEGMQGWGGKGLKLLQSYKYMKPHKNIYKTQLISR